MSPTLALLDGIGVSEMLLVAFVSVLVYGGKLPDVLRNLGRAYAKFRQGLSEMSRPLREEIERATTLPPVQPPPPLKSGAAEVTPFPAVAYDVGAAPGGADPGGGDPGPAGGGAGGPTPAPLSQRPLPPPRFSPQDPWGLPQPPPAPPKASAGDPFDEPPPV